MTRFPAHRTHHAHTAPRPVRARRRLLAFATTIALFAALFAIASLSACGGGGSSPIGADEVVYPEREMAEKLAVRYNATNIFDFIELTKE